MQMSTFGVRLSYFIGFCGPPSMDRCRALAWNRLNHTRMEKSMTPPYALVVCAHGSCPQKCLSMGPATCLIQNASKDPSWEILSDCPNLQV